eukprot:gene16775-18470_t
MLRRLFPIVIRPRPGLLSNPKHIASLYNKFRNSDANNSALTFANSSSTFRDVKLTSKNSSQYDHIDPKKWNSNEGSSDFTSLGVGSKLVEKLSNLRISKPVEIQSLALPSVFRYQNVIIQSETGSGKTLTYLLPVIQQAKNPCGTMIIVPTRELAYQIYIEARKLTEKKNVACFVTRKGIDKDLEHLKLRQPKIVIGTPKQLLQVVLDHEFLFTGIRRVVTDEIDKMLPSIPLHLKNAIKKRQQNPKALDKLLAVLQGISKERVQYIACSATINEQLTSMLKDLGWGYKLRHIKPKKYNYKERIVPASIAHNYILVPDDSIDSKAAAVSRIFNRTKHKNALVFVHKDHSVNEYVREMQDLHLNAVAFYRQVLSGATADIIKFLDEFRTGKISVVVASEEEVRGLDFKDLEHVYLFDVPRSIDDYLHLAGRVGRLGNKGTVTTVISELYETRLARLKAMYRDLGISPKELIL